MSSAAERRIQITESVAAAPGIDEAMIERLVRSFYGRIRTDAVLGPIFEARITDWEPHLKRMCAFWSSVTLLTGRYSGQPMRVHAPLPIAATHFDRWLGLFTEAAAEVCPPEAARHFVFRAGKIAESLELGIAVGQGVTLKRGERFLRP